MLLHRENDKPGVFFYEKDNSLNILYTKTSTFNRHFIEKFQRQAKATLPTIRFHCFPTFARLIFPSNTISVQCNSPDNYTPQPNEIRIFNISLTKVLSLKTKKPAVNTAGTHSFASKNSNFVWTNFLWFSPSS